MGCVFDIQRFSVHDGPGIRTNVFLKGCPLRCRWCCNPESMDPKPEVLFQAELCINCGKCRTVCPVGAVGPAGIDRALCTNCCRCAQDCYAEALTVKGRHLSPQDVVDEAVKDRAFYARSGGGVTFSGGEPLLQIDFLEEALRLCKSQQLHTAIETCGHVPWAHFERIAPLVDVFLFDIKHTDTRQHRDYTGVGCEGIMENCQRLAGIANRLIVRVPVIPTFNFDVEALTKIVRFAERIGVREVDFLPYHRLAANKYTFLGRVCWNPGMDRLADSVVVACVQTISSTIKLRIGG